MTKKIDQGGPAFPSIGNVGYKTEWVSEDGMSLRDYFAAQFLARSCADDAQPLDLDIAADQYDVDSALRAHWDIVARTAYIAADAMIAARSRVPE